MNAEKKALLLVGSPKTGASTSESLGLYCLNLLEEKGFEVEKLHINRCLKTISGQDELIGAANSCNILILAFPLYADSLPSGVIKAMEMLVMKRAEQVGSLGAAKNQIMLAICNSGFPEAHQNDTALDICRCFAGEARYTWAGGLALGAGGAINGQPLRKMGRMMNNLRKALDLTIEALVEGRSIPEEADALVRRSFMPRWLYIFIGNTMWKIQAWKNGVLMKINDRPYEDLGKSDLI